MLFHYDFHVHTSRYSSCSHSPPDAVCRRALSVGLAGIAFTEHDRWWPASEVEELRVQFPDLVILHGAEFSCTEGHFLVFLPDAVSGEALASDSILELVHQVHRIGGIIIWAHPFRYDRSTPVWLEDVLVDGIEVASTNMDEQATNQALKIAESRGINTFENSDAHDVDSIGTYRNKIPYILKNNADLIDYARKSR